MGGTLDLLVVSNVWPPHFIGGYELGAEDVVRRLAARGHRATVLTSTYDVPGPRVDGTIHRLLWEEMHWRPLGARGLLAASWGSARSVPRARRFLRDQCFDLVYLFNPACLNAGIVQELAASGRPVVAYVSDNWAAEWPWCDRVHLRWMTPRPYLPPARRLALAVVRRLLRRVRVLPRLPEVHPIRHAQFVSRFIRDLSVPKMPIASQEVIPWGIEVGRFRFRERRPEELRRWLYVGQLEEHKGAQTAVDAVARLRAAGEAVELTIVGHDTTPYGGRLKARVAREGLDAAVRFRGARPRERLPEEAYDRHGLLVFPSLWDEPFSITLLEAFAAGIPVLTTMTGGTGEIVRHGETASVFSAGSVEHLVAQFHALVAAPDEAARMARRARAIVVEHCDVERMVDRVERHLVEVAEGRGSEAVDPPSEGRHPWEPDDVRVDVPTRAVEPDPDGRWLAALWAEVGPDDEARRALGPLLSDLVRSHPRHAYLATDPRVQEWFRAFERPGERESARHVATRRKT